MSERLRARWGEERGIIELYDPVRREWHALVAKGLPRWVFDLLPGRRRVDEPRAQEAGRQAPAADTA